MAAGSKKPDFNLADFGELQPKGVLSKDEAQAPSALPKAQANPEKRPKDAKQAAASVGPRRMGGEGGRPTFKANTECGRLNMYLPVDTIMKLKRAYLIHHTGQFRSMTEIVDRAINAFIDGGCK